MDHDRAIPWTMIVRSIRPETGRLLLMIMECKTGLGVL